MTRRNPHPKMSKRDLAASTLSIRITLSVREDLAILWQSRAMEHLTEGHRHSAPGLQAPLRSANRSPISTQSNLPSRSRPPALSIDAATTVRQSETSNDPITTTDSISTVRDHQPGQPTKVQTPTQQPGTVTDTITISDNISNVHVVSHACDYSGIAL